MSNVIMEPLILIVLLSLFAGCIAGIGATPDKQHRIAMLAGAFMMLILCSFFVVYSVLEVMINASF